MKTLGILNACTPDDEVEFGTKEFEDFERFLKMTTHQLELREYRITEGEFPHSVDDCDAYLITGSPKGAYDTDQWIAELIQFIRQAYAESVKMVGVCFGHQVLAHALGGKAEKSPKGWGLGLNQVAVEGERPFMTPPLANGNFYFCHQDQVIRLPAEAERLAGNDFCHNGMFVIDGKVFGIQAHPEFTPQVMDIAIEWIATTMPEEKETAEKAAQANGVADNVAIANWIINFINS